MNKAAVVDFGIGVGIMHHSGVVASTPLSRWHLLQVAACHPRGLGLISRGPIACAAWCIGTVVIVVGIVMGHIWHSGLSIFVSGATITIYLRGCGAHSGVI